MTSECAHFTLKQPRKDLWKENKVYACKSILSFPLPVSLGFGWTLFPRALPSPLLCFSPSGLGFLCFQIPLLWQALFIKLWFLLSVKHLCDFKGLEQRFAVWLSTPLQE